MTSIDRQHGIQPKTTTVTRIVCLLDSSRRFAKSLSDLRINDMIFTPWSLGFLLSPALIITLGSYLTETARWWRWDRAQNIRPSAASRIESAYSRHAIKRSKLCG